VTPMFQIQERGGARGRLSMAIGAALALAQACFAAPASAQQFAPQQFAPAKGAVGWRAWVFSAAPASPERPLDLGIAPDDRTSRVGAVVTYPVVNSLQAGLRLDGTVDATGARANKAFLVLRLPLFGPAEPRAPAGEAIPAYAPAPPAPATAAPARGEAPAQPGLLARLLDPAFYRQALRLPWFGTGPDIPEGDEAAATSDVRLPPLRSFKQQ